MQRLRRGSRWLLLAFFAAWGVGAVLFVSADGSFTWTFPVAERAPAGEHNVALYRWGPTIRASSFFRDVDAHHHPAFLVDGHPAPDPLEKWASSKSDGRPWVEILWRAPRTLSHVTIRHAGWKEEDELTARRYRITCLTAGESPAPLAITDNRLAISTHRLSCADARGVRIDWHLNLAGEPVRVFEIEAWGQ